MALDWISSGNQKFSTPLSAELRVYIGKPSQPVVSYDTSVDDIQLTHYPILPDPDWSGAGDLPLLITADSTKIETRTLKLIGYQGLEKPKIDLFPAGKTMAVVTSWDDG